MDREFLEIIQQQFQRQNEAFLQAIHQLKTSEQVGAPRRQTETEFLIESLSSSITEFVFDLESNSTFENWFNRYKDLFECDAKNLDDAAKIRLLLRKLDPSSYSKYINVILPKESLDFTFDETITKLKQIFGRNESIFNIRYKCFQLTKKDDMDILSYQGLVNKTCENFKLSELSSDQFKCLIFVMGLSSKSDFDIRIKLLSKLDTDSNITLDTLTCEYNRLLNLKKDSSMIQDRNQNDSIQINKIKTEREFSKKKNSIERDSCLRCGKKPKHPLNECPAKGQICHFCEKRDHFISCCFKNPESKNFEIFSNKFPDNKFNSSSDNSD